ncbi:MAG: hypothetical protein JSU94_02895 [Phycisphaerales bacterium]|nr:MAG: hypothetical protein JSU94_02895 [Phycisphaerales bacterium]
MGFIDILTKPLRLGSSKLAWQEPSLYPIRLRGDALRRLLIAVGIGLVAACIILCVFALQEQPRDRDFALAGGICAAGFALLLFFFRRSHVGGRIVFGRDTIQRTTLSCGYPCLFVVSNARWEYGVISDCVFVLGKDIGRRFSIMLFSYGGSQQMIAIPKRIDPREVAGILAKHGVRVQRGRRLPEYATQGLSLPATTVSVAAGLVALVVVPVLYLRQGPPERKRPIAQYPQIPGLDEIRKSPFPSLPPRIDPRGTGEGGLPEDRPNADLDGMRQMRDGMRQMRDGMRQMRDGARPMGNGMIRERPGSFSSSRPPGLAAPGIPRSDNTDAVNCELTETVGGTGGSAFRNVDSQGRPVIGVQFALGSWAGGKHVSRLTPLFDRSRATRPNTILAKEGYALGAIHVRAGEFVDAITLEFMKLNDGASLQLSDSYKADTIGSATSGTAKTITSDGRLIVGLHGRRGAMIDAIGLVVRK